MSRQVFPAAVVAILVAQTMLVAQSDATAIEHKLSQELISIDFESVPLELAVYRIIGQFSAAVRVHWPEDLELQADRLSLTLDQQPIGTVLRQVLGTQRLDYRVEAGEIVVIREKERRCVEIEESAERFRARAIEVDMVLRKADRCDSRAMVGIGGGPGNMVSEGIAIDPEVTVGLIQGTGVVFLFEGRCFEIRIAGAPVEFEPEIESDAGDATGAGTMRPSPDDERAFNGLRLRVLGTVHNADDPRASFAVINGKDYYVGDRIEGTPDAIVKEIHPTYVLFGFRGFDWSKYNGE